MPYTQHGLPFASGSDTSLDAAIAAHGFVGEQGARVLAWVQARGAFGATQKEAEAALGIGRPSLCARFLALELIGALRNTRAKRDKCAVYTAAERWGQ